MPACFQWNAARGKIDVPGRDASRRRHINPKGPRDVRPRVLRVGVLERTRVRVAGPRHHQHRQRSNRRHRQNGEARPVAVVSGQREGHDQGSRQSPDLIHRLVQPEAPAGPHGLGGVSQHDVAGRRSNGFAEPLRDHEQRGHFPAPRQRQQRHGEQVHGVPEHHDRPVFLAAIGEIARGQSKRVADQLACPGHRGDNDGRGAQQAEKRPRDAARPFVSYVREEAHDAEHHDEAHRASARAGVRVHKITSLQKPRGRGPARRRFRRRAPGVGDPRSRRARAPLG